MKESFIEFILIGPDELTYFIIITHKFRGLLVVYLTERVYKIIKTNSFLFTGVEPFIESHSDDSLFY
jgi:hypothetical protein